MTVILERTSQMKRVGGLFLIIAKQTKSNLQDWFNFVEVGDRSVCSNSRKEKRLLYA
jgi:hypothetical protein